MRIIAKVDLRYTGPVGPDGRHGPDEEVCLAGEEMQLVPESELSFALAKSLRDVRRRTDCRVLPVVWRGRVRWVDVGIDVDCVSPTDDVASQTVTRRRRG